MIIKVIQLYTRASQPYVLFDPGNTFIAEIMRLLVVEIQLFGHPVWVMHQLT